MRSDRVRDMNRASSKERGYFRRVAAENRCMDDGSPPASLAETFDRLEDMERRLGQLGRTGADGPHDGDLKSHLAYLARLRAVDPSYRTR